MSNYNDGKTYWAALENQDLLLELHRHNENYYRDLQDTKLFYVWERSYMAYYGAQLGSSNFSGQLFDSTEITRSGERNQITNLKTNHYRNLIQHTLQLVTADRPAWSCRASNTDYKSQVQCILGKGLLDYYFREKNFQKYYKQVVENALIFSEGWIYAPWSETSGNKLITDAETGVNLFEGDFEFSAHSPLNVIRDISIRNDERHEWLTVRTFENKYNLASKYQEFADAILMESSEFIGKYDQLESFDMRIRRGAKVETDRIPVWTWYHIPTEALPEGRMCIYTQNEMLFSGPMPYEKIPLYPVFPENLIGTPYGYSPAFDLLGPQQAIDILTSTVMTNNAANGVQNLWTRKGDDISVGDLGGGLKHLMSEERPEGIQLTKSAPETYSFRRELIEEMETLMGISSTVRGNPEASLKSGAALALIVSQSIQFSSILEMAVNTMLEEFGTALLNNLKVFAKSERVVTIMGETARSYQKTFEAKDLEGVSRVTVERVSPISKTTAGRLQIADTLLEKGLIQDAKQYVMVLATGQLENLTEDIQTEMLNIRAENEALRKGEEVVAVITENQAQHIRAHSYLLNHEAKKDPEYVTRVFAHIKDHLELWKNMTPDVAMVTGQQMSPSSTPVGQVPQGGAPADVMMAEQGPITTDQLPTQPSMPALPSGSPPESQEAYDSMLNNLT